MLANHQADEVNRLVSWGARLSIGGSLRFSDMQATPPSTLTLGSLGVKARSGNTKTTSEESGRLWGAADVSLSGKDWLRTGMGLMQHIQAEHNLPHDRDYLVPKYSNGCWLPTPMTYEQWVSCLHSILGVADITAHSLKVTLIT